MALDMSTAVPITKTVPNNTAAGSLGLATNGMKNVATGNAPAPLDMSTAQPVSDTSQQQPGLLSAAASAVGGAIKDTAIGFGKGALQTATALGTGTSKILGKLPGKVGQFFQGGAQEGQQDIKSATQTPQNTAESIGYGAEKVGEFFVPGSAEESAMNAVTEHINKLPEALGIAGKGAELLTGALKTAAKSVISGGTGAAVQAAQGGTTEQIKSTGETMAAFGGLGQAVQSFGKPLADALNKADFKLSPAAAAKASQKAKSAASFMTDNKITGTNAIKYTKLDNLNQKLETTLQASLPDSLQVPKKDIIDSINSGIESLRTKDPAVYNKAKNAADEAIALLQQQPGDGIPVKDALNGKRSYGSVAFKSSKAAVRDPNVVAEGHYAVEQAYQKALSNTLDANNSAINVPKELQSYFGNKNQVNLQDFNKVYSNAISAKNLTQLAQFKNDTGLVGRMFGLWAGEAIGQAVLPGLGGKFGGAAVGEIASSHVPGLVRNIGEQAVERGGVIPKGAKIGVGINSAIQNSQDGQSGQENQNQ